MECNVETAVRISPIPYNNREILCVQPNAYNNTIQLGNAHTYPVNHLIPADCCQNTLFTTIVSPLLNYLFEGCDVSVVTIGQSGTGKSYTLLGPGLNCTLSESEHGVIPRFVREVFSRVTQNSDRNCSIHVTWSQICGENVQDLLGTGSVECTSVSDAFQLIQMGMSNIAPKCAHTLFTVTLEQQWISDNTVQHRISTASFADLAGSDKMLVMDSNGLTQSIPTDPGLLTLQRCVIALTEPFVSHYSASNIPYNQSVLTTLLKDSFGGRAKTIVICCVSPFLRDFSDTFYTLQFALRAQLVKNFITINSYTTFDTIKENLDVFGLQFAANQLLKLVTNAEELFQKLVANGQLPKHEMESIAQWLMLKQECEECLSETSEHHRSLERIEEEIEDTSDSSENEIPEEETETLLDRLDMLMKNFRVKTDQLVSKSNSSCTVSINSGTKESIQSSNCEYHSKGARGRRGSIHSAEELDPTVLVLEESISETENKEAATMNLTYEMKQKLLKQMSAESQGHQKQISDLLRTIQIKESLLQKLLKHQDTKAKAKEKLQQKCQKLKTDLENIHSKVLQAHSQDTHYLKQQYKIEAAKIEKKLKDAQLIKNITEDSSRKIMELENSLYTSRKQLEKLRKYRRKEEKHIHALEMQLKEEKKKQIRSKSVGSNKVVRNTEDHSADSAALVVHKKLGALASVSLSNENLDSLRHEIRDLRKSRECLLEQRCKIDTKVTNKKILNDIEECKLLQYEEAIEAIDLAIEYKNRLMCGHLPITEKCHDTDFTILVAVAMKLNENELRIILQRYFEKIIDLRSSSKKLEVQVMDVEDKNESLYRRVQSLSRTLQQIRYEAERETTSMLHQHEDNLHLVMEHLASDGCDNKVFSQIVECSKQTALALKVAGVKQVDKSSFMGKFTWYTQQTVPKQLKAITQAPQAKYTKEKNKLIFQQSSK